jgi:tetratricopeptide (TPR) repeat protein
VYANTASHELVLDATALVGTNPLIRSLSEIPSLFRSDYWAPRVEGGLYRPLATTSFALTWALAGDDPRPYHVTHIFLHAANAALVVLLGCRLTPDRLAAGAAGLLFAAHAINTEVVANVAGRADLLGTFFLLLAFLAYTARATRTGRRAAALQAASLGAYAVALLSKENAITLLGIILLYDFVYDAGEQEARPLRRVGRLVRRYLGSRYAGYLAVTLGYVAVRYVWLGIGDPSGSTTRLDNPLLHLDPPWGLVNALKVVFLYVGLFLFPLHLAYDRSHAQIALITSPADPAFALVLVGSLLSLAIVVWSWRASKPLFFALGFALVTFSVVSNLVIGIGTIMAERLLYLPCIGFCLATGIGLRLVLQRAADSGSVSRALFVALLAAMVGLNACRTVVRNRDWASNEALFLHDLALSPRSARVHSNAGHMFRYRGQLEKAIEHYRTAVEIYPEGLRMRVALGATLLQAGREEEAIPVYEYLVERRISDPRIWNDLGYLLVDRGIDVERGLELILVAVDKDPEDPHTLDSLGWAHYKSGRLAEARSWIRRSLEIDPEAETPRRHLDEIERALGGAADADP